MSAIRFICVIDGVFSQGAAGELRFHSATVLSQSDVAAVQSLVRHRVLRLFERNCHFRPRRPKIDGTVEQQRGWASASDAARSLGRAAYVPATIHVHPYPRARACADCSPRTTMRYGIAMSRNSPNLPRSTRHGVVRPAHRPEALSTQIRPCGVPCPNHSVLHGCR